MEILRCLCGIFYLQWLLADSGGVPTQSAAIGVGAGPPRPEEGENDCTLHIVPRPWSDSNVMSKLYVLLDHVLAAVFWAFSRHENTSMSTLASKGLQVPFLLAIQGKCTSHNASHV